MRVTSFLGRINGRINGRFGGRIAGAGLAAAVLLASPVVRADEAQARLDGLLGAIDTQVERGPLEQAIPDAHARLLAAAQDEGRTLYARMRATAILSQFPEGATRPVLEKLSNGGPEELRATALRSLAVAYGDQAVVERLVRASNDASSLVRDRAVRALRWCRPLSADLALERIATTTTDPSLRQVAELTRERRARAAADGVPGKRPQ